MSRKKEGPKGDSVQWRESECSRSPSKVLPWLRSDQLSANAAPWLGVPDAQMQGSGAVFRKRSEGVTGFVARSQ